METDRTRRLLRLIAIAAIADFALLIPLVIASLTDAHSVISVLGPVHGIGFLIQLGLVLKGVGEDRWGWWFPAVVVVTLGPPGALYGHFRVRRELQPA